LRRLEVACLLITAAALAWLVVLWARMVVSPAPQEMREAAPLLTTVAFLAGRNPYALATLPDGANVYGPLYPLLAVPFVALIADALVAMRVANAVCLTIACAVLHHLCRRQGAAILPALLGTGLAMAGWLYWVGATVRPDGLALALSLGGCAVFTRGPPSWRGFLPALLLWLLAFATKIYFVFPAFVAAAWIFCTGRFRLGVLFGATAAAGLAATIVALTLLFPGWPPVVLGSSLGTTIFDANHLVRQTGDWALFSLPLLAGTIAVLPRASAWQWRVPGFFTFAALCGALALATSLGGHDGAHMTYFFHLLSPFAIIAMTGAAGSSTAPARAMALSFPVSILLCAHHFPWRIGAFAAAEADFTIAARLIADAMRPLATTEFAPLLFRAGWPAPENGHAEYFAAAIRADPPRVLAFLWPTRALLQARAESLDSAIRDGIAARRFDLVLTNPFGFGLIPRPLLQAEYRVVGHLPVAMPWASQRWQAEIWRPRGD
jgi:hypothetical protein